MKPRLLKVKEVAAHLGISVNSVHTLLRNEKLQGINLGTSFHPRWRIEPDAMEKYKRMYVLGILDPVRERPSYERLI